MRMGSITYYALILSLCAIITASLSITLRNVLSPRPNTLSAEVVAAASFETTPEYEDVEKESPLQQHHIPWRFIAYAEPDFLAEQVENYSPQYVTILEENSDGWALIEISEGKAWVYLPDNLLHLDRVMGLFEDISEAYPIDVIKPQLVRVLDQEGYWLQIDTWHGPMWVDLLFTPPSSVLDEFMAQFGNSVSVYYENLESGYIYTHNASKTYFGASAIKGPYALWVYLLAENGNADLSTIYTYTSADHWGGSGVIQRMPFGSTFSGSELLGLALSESDNIAFRMLVRKIHGVSGFRDWVEEIGGDPSLVHTVTYSRLTANEAGNFAREMHRYIESDGKYSEEFRQHLLNNRYQFVTSDHRVASKSGWAEGAYHDIAIVYSPSPYSLIIMSEGTGGAADRRIYRDISEAFQSFNDLYFAPVNTLEISD